MRKLVFIFGLMCVCVSGFTQKRWQEPPNPPMPVKPLIVIDNRYYADDLNRVKPNDIKKVEILKSAAAAAIYGRQAANGAILVTTKHNKPVKMGAHPLVILPDTLRYGKIILMNLETGKEGLDTLNTDEIIDYKFLKKGSTAYAANGSPVLLLFTRDYAIKIYLNKLCSVTQGYRKYLNDNNFSDSKVLYDVNGEYRKRDDTLIKYLYELPVGDIKNTVFIEDYKMKGMSSTIFKITTKKH
ncbi:TonB-dependent receptor plug domain-containing protein [Mucilaginibacter sp. ZT4R22]|uniref:TonB-dependent receptor plug domain-containing protein n=1 Tax=Mucilaginibacter pankratovii TaxID=2772110 RepID=A0ABR7WSD4_9SPHI|nr:TonB-dependent receptor plug domain-containing protein [Mucilaginibacter pankratovii]MBD1365216.1 TonB-dependent receptor plug domain-containing protein [Mucilaginibacter pankratovii]